MAVTDFFTEKELRLMRQGIESLSYCFPVVALNILNEYKDEKGRWTHDEEHNEFDFPDVKTECNKLIEYIDNLIKNNE